MRPLLTVGTLVVSLALSIGPAGAAAGQDSSPDPHVAGRVDRIDSAHRTVVVEGVTVSVPSSVRGLRRLHAGQPAVIWVRPGAHPPVAVRIEALPE